MSCDLTCEAATQRSRCLYCGSVSYGKGCRYAPGGVHFHASDPLKCSYCGSKDFGKGCHMNPFDKIHVHGIPYNSMVSEDVEGIMNNWSLLQELKRPIESYEAFQRGLIDENGNLIKEPTTQIEKSAINEEIRSILKIRKFLGSKLDLICNTSLLEGSQNLSDSYNTREKLQKLLVLEDKMSNVYNDFCEVLSECQNEGLTLSQIKSLISK